VGGHVGLERIGLPATAVEREHQLPAQALPQRMGAHQRFKLRGHVHVCAEREVSLDPLFERGDAQMLQSRNFRLGERLVDEVGQRRSSP
jgi:hypothetical protein